jgi:Fe-Mn family superoxide dismutase
LDFAKAPNFIINGLKREALIAANCMILREFYFDGLGGAVRPAARCAGASTASRGRRRLSSEWTCLPKQGAVATQR